MSLEQPVCPDCGRGAMRWERCAQAYQSDDGTRVAVVKNVPRLRCPVCEHHELDATTAVLVGGLLGGALKRNQVTVFDWETAFDE